MAKLGCICGHTIVDQTDNIPYKGHILPDTSIEKTWEEIANKIDTLIDSIQSNRKLEWIKQNFTVPPYPTDVSDSSMIYDLLSTSLSKSTQDIFECENCGRIAIEIGQTNHFRFFRQDEEGERGILNTK